MAQADTPLLFRVCDSTGCNRRFMVTAGDRHRHCCSACGQRDGRQGSQAGHTRRCQRQQRMLHDPPVACCMRGCNRSTNIGHRTCCSTCRSSGSRMHTARCHRLHSAVRAAARAASQPAPQAATTVQQSVSTAAPSASSSSTEAVGLLAHSDSAGVEMSSQAGSVPAWEMSSSSSEVHATRTDGTDARLSSSARPVQSYTSSVELEETD